MSRFIFFLLERLTFPMPCFFFFIFMLYDRVGERDRQEGVADRGEDMQNRTRVAAIRSNLNGTRSTR